MLERSTRFELENFAHGVRIQGVPERSILHYGDKAFNIAKDPKYDGYQRGLASMVYKFFDKKTTGSGIKYVPQNEQLAEELHKSIIREI